ncbi:KAP family P-loop NTPase fold protein [Oceanobacter mangrovi]|uniref:KAP family P-loop NTPase fold protein n=1 Tax=Oceanobacter mangrovi TaxID=2862510 RepID=UPI001C8CF3F1|nr:P-loop NTPase fold protein [Oceanobacter mangrovi]
MSDTNQTPSYDWTAWEQESIWNGKETLSADKLDRSRYAEFLTNYLNTAGQRDGGYVMNLNAEWGAGKTWFLKRWCETLKPYHPVAYIDAWKNDFSDDPLLTVIDGVIEALRNNPNVRALDYESRLFSKLKLFGKAAAETLLNERGLGSFQELLGLHREKAQDIETSRKVISQWLEDVTEGPNRGNYRKPMYVFIDELDRCRPTYAIELLETVKHLFELQNIVFVIATNTDQLQHSIKAVYGEGFDANRYLNRFFHRRHSLKIPELLEYISGHQSFRRFSVWLLTVAEGGISTTEGGLANFLCGIAECSDFDLRTTSQWLEQIESIYATKSNRDDFYWGVVALLLSMRLQNSEFYYIELGLVSSSKYLTNAEYSKLQSESFLKARPRNIPSVARRFSLSVSTRCLERSDCEETTNASKRISVPIDTVDTLECDVIIDSSWTSRAFLSKLRSTNKAQIYHKFWDGSEPGEEEGFLLAFFHCASVNSEIEFRDYLDLVEMGACLGE